jgi:hypothetical protein
MLLLVVCSIWRRMLKQSADMRKGGESSCHRGAVVCVIQLGVHISLLNAFL